MENQQKTFSLFLWYDTYIVRIGPGRSYIWLEPRQWRWAYSLWSVRFIRRNISWTRERFVCVPFSLLHTLLLARNTCVSTHQCQCLFRFCFVSVARRSLIHLFCFVHNFDMHAHLVALCLCCVFVVSICICVCWPPLLVRLLLLLLHLLDISAVHLCMHNVLLPLYMCVIQMNAWMRVIIQSTCYTLYHHLRYWMPWVPAGLAQCHLRVYFQYYSVDAQYTVHNHTFDCTKYTTKWLICLDWCETWR